MNLRWAVTRHLVAEGNIWLRPALSSGISCILSAPLVKSLLSAARFLDPMESFILIPFSFHFAPVKQTGEGSRAPCQWSPGPKDSFK
jgi:hypothetical protein